MGKSTFLGLFNGITRPSQGIIKVCGVDISEHPQITRQSIGMLFANPDAQLIMPTVLEDLELSLRRHSSLTRAQRLEQAHKLLAQQCLDDKADQNIFFSLQRRETTCSPHWDFSGRTTNPLT